MGSEKRKLSLFVTIQLLVLVCLLLVGLMIFHESRLLRKSVRILQQASGVNTNDDNALSKLRKQDELRVALEDTEKLNVVGLLKFKRLIVAAKHVRFIL